MVEYEKASAELAVEWADLYNKKLYQSKKPRIAYALTLLNT